MNTLNFPKPVYCFMCFQNERHPERAPLTKKSRFGYELALKHSFVIVHISEN